jgi:hypothetical protein
MSHNVCCAKLSFFSRLRRYDILVKSEENASNNEHLAYSYSSQRERREV